MIATSVVISTIVKEFNLKHKLIHVDCTFNSKLDVFEFCMKRVDSIALIARQISITELYDYKCLSVLIYSNLNEMYRHLVKEKHIKDSTELSGGHLW